MLHSVVKVKSVTTDDQFYMWRTGTRRSSHYQPGIPPQGNKSFLLLCFRTSCAVENYWLLYHLFIFREADLVTDCRIPPDTCWWYGDRHSSLVKEAGWWNWRRLVIVFHTPTLDLHTLLLLQYSHVGSSPWPADTRCAPLGPCARPRPQTGRCCHARAAAAGRWRIHLGNSGG